ncbi:Nuclear prelamin A recognition factor [Myotis brandtii]|uniref:Nuclear prelamin A recognition factor n=1 Tax=Myotis brandtii TaxID=109478 RepID=S7MY02_MYOBR|nr:Nuclear prelamin A recognition factor [Myotis brandtii]
MDQCCWHNPDSTDGLLELGLGHLGRFPSLDAPQGRKDIKASASSTRATSEETKTDDQENVAVNVQSPAQENGEKREFHKLAEANIFLSDCLACDSGVTAEEGVQVSQQNTKDFFRVLNLNMKCDTSQHKIAVDFSILESQKEFVHPYCQHREEEPRLPMLTSTCPSWVRYAERMVGHPITPHLCTAKSPQQIMGSLVKDYFTRRQNLNKIFHVIVAPCYDKKLEAL